MNFLRIAAVALLGSACGGLVVQDGGPPAVEAPRQANSVDGGVAPGIDAAAEPASEGGGGGGGAGGGVVLYSGEPVYTLALDGTDLFFTVLYGGGAPSPLQVKKCSVDDCSAPKLVGAGGDGLPGLAVDANNVYWSANFSNEMWRCPRTGCGTAVKLDTGPYPRGIASDGTDVFYTADGAVWKCAAVGCAEPTKVVGAPWNTNGIAIDADNVYFTSDNGGVGMCPKTGCASPTIVAPGPYRAADIAVDATDIYWASGTGVFRCAIAGCNGSPTELTPYQAWSLAVDDTNVYFTMLRSIGRCSKSGCVGEPTVIAADQFAPADLVLDAANVYWSNRPMSGGEIRKAPKN